MGSLVQHITAISAAKYGVNILELDPPAGVRATTSRVVGIIGEFPWGPLNELTEVSSLGEFFDTFAPPAFANLDDYDALKALINKRFGRLLVCRVQAAAGAAATKAFLGAAAADSVTVTALYKGAAGNLIKVAWTENADDATARDATVSIGTAYSKTYLAVATIVSAALVVTDPGDPFVVFTKTVDATVVPAAIAATALAAGADGTAVAGEYVGSISSDVGIRKFYGENVDIGVLFVAECPSGLVDAVNAGLLAYNTDTDKGLAILCSVPSQAKATAKTYPTTYADDRGVYPWPRVKTINTYDPDRAEITVDGNAFIASTIVQTDPWVSPGGPRRAEYLRGITGLADESATKDDYEELKAAGVCCFFMVRNVGAIIRGAVTTSTTAGKTKIYRRRMVDYITSALAERWALDVESELDVDLAGQSLGPVSGGQISDANVFLQGLWEQGRGIATVNGAPGFAVDPFSLNVQADLDANRWLTKITVKLAGTQDEAILAANIGESVQVSEV